MKNVFSEKEKRVSTPPVERKDGKKKDSKDFVLLQAMHSRQHQEDSASSSHQGKLLKAHVIAPEDYAGLTANFAIKLYE